MRERFTIQEFIDAMKKNGYPWHKGTWYSETRDAYCVMGQGMMNLELGPASNPNDSTFRRWARAYDKINAQCSGAAIAIGDMNDKDTTTSYEQALEFAVGILLPYKDEVIQVD